MFSPYPHKRKNVNYFSHSKDPYFLWKYVQFRVKLPLRYLRDTYEKGILFSRDIKQDHILWGWVDDDWEGDTGTHRSHTGFFFTTGFRLSFYLWTWMHVHQRNGVTGRVHVCYPTGFRFHSKGFYHPLCRNMHIPHGFILLWNRLPTPQDTHDQERNTPSVSLVKCTRFGCARDWEDKQQWLAGEFPSATARLYSNGRNSYSSLVPYTRRSSKIVICASFFLVLLVRFNALLLVSKSSRTFSQTFWNCLVLLVRFGET